MSRLWSCVVGPRLYRIYGALGTIDESVAYVPNPVEKLGNNAIQGLKVMWNIGIYASPLVVTYLWRREYFCLMGCLSLGKIATGLSILFAVSMLLRGLGRFTNSNYQNFLQTYQGDSTKAVAIKANLSRYDFEFWAWPVDFTWDEVEGENGKPRLIVDQSLARMQSGPIQWAITLPCQIAAWFCAHAFGRHLMYPGSVLLLQYAIDQFLVTGRDKLVKENNGKRNKITTRDGNYIDTMFVDHRNSGAHPHGSTLVVCCEGNAGFYEMGIMTTPLEAGYSVLGWNHPGFAGSSGTPFPSQESNAIDSVMQFAIHKLGFQTENIIVYAWSIGGYAGTWAAMNYPQIRGLILDASFDDVLPLAIPWMPRWMGILVRRTIRDYLNLNNSEQLNRYPGPVSIIRRTEDEIIATKEDDLSTNRCNHLLMKLLKSRFPALHCNESVETLNYLLSVDPRHQEPIMRKYTVDDDYCLALLKSYTEEHGETFPMNLGEDWKDSKQQTKMLLFLAKKYLVDFEAKHNNPLEARYFKMPWTPFGDASYVQIA